MAGGQANTMQQERAAPFAASGNSKLAFSMPTGQETALPLPMQGVMNFDPRKGKK